jgi:hypothetical protein
MVSALADEVLDTSQDGVAVTWPNSRYLELRNTVNTASGAVYRFGAAPYSGAATTDETDPYGATTGSVRLDILRGRAA